MICDEPSGGVCLPRVISPRLVAATFCHCRPSISPLRRLHTVTYLPTPTTVARCLYADDALMLMPAAMPLPQHFCLRHADTTTCRHGAYRAR